MRSALLFILTTISLQMMAQQGRITGTIRSADGRGLESVNIMLTGTSTGTVSNSAGEYSISADAGDYLMAVSTIGFAAQERKVDAESRRKACGKFYAGRNIPAASGGNNHRCAGHHGYGIPGGNE